MTEFLVKLSPVLLLLGFVVPPRYYLVGALIPGVDPNDPLLDDLLNTCIDGVNHKSKPGPEDGLHMQCEPWANRSCCTSDISVKAHYQKMYNFDWNHCSMAKSLSSKCSKHFIQDLCFYECSPNVGPWLQKVDMKIRKERYYKVPLCASDCSVWFEDCAEDLTCTDNWTLNFKWVSGLGNQCPRGSTCQTFRQIYRNSKYFCETVWDHSWEVVPDDDHCMRLYFSSAAGNPNDDVARWKVNQILKGRRRGSSSGEGGLHSSFEGVLAVLVAAWTYRL